LKPYEHLARGPSCVRLEIPPTACYLHFVEGPGFHSQMLDLETARGERLIVDFDAKGKVVGIELIGPGKACQEG